MTIRKISEEYIIEDGDKFGIRVIKSNSKLTVSPRHGGDFTFIKSEPKVVEKIGKLLITASKLP